MNFLHLSRCLYRQPILVFLCLATFISLPLQSRSALTQVVEKTVDKDDLAIDSSLPWGIKKWSYSKVIEVLDLAESVYGRVVIDRYGIDESASPIKQPFSRIKPGKIVFATIWGSNFDGCYVETVVQAAPKKEIRPEATLPTLLEIALDGKIMELSPRVTNPQITSYRYNYLSGNNSQKQGVWHMNHRIFDIDADQAFQLMNTQIEDIKARFHFGASKTIKFKIGADTVERWQDIFAFNADCKYIP